MKITRLLVGVLVPAAAVLASPLPVMAPESFPVPMMGLLGSARADAAAKRHAQDIENEIFRIPNNPWAPEWPHANIMRMYHHLSQPDEVDFFIHRHLMKTGEQGQVDRWASLLQAPSVSFPTVLPAPAVRRLITEFVVDPRFNGDLGMIKGTSFSADPKFSLNPRQLPLPLVLGR